MKFIIIIIFTSFLFLPAKISAQYDTKVSHSYKSNNDYFKFSHLPLHGIKSNVVPFGIDSFNLCRIRAHKISKVEVYKYSSPNDSSLAQVYHYNKLGHIIEMTPKIGWFMYASVDFNEFKVDCCCYQNPLKKVRKRYKKNKKTKLNLGYQIVNHYDSLGYVTSSLSKMIGFNRLLFIVLSDGPTDSRHIYQYNDNYTKVKVHECYTGMNKFPKAYHENCIENSYRYFEYTIDSLGNIISEMWYRKDENGDFQFDVGYKSFYEYGRYNQVPYIANKDDRKIGKWLKSGRK
jgi:hypothetical protein